MQKLSDRVFNVRRADGRLIGVSRLWRNRSGQHYTASLHTGTWFRADTRRALCADIGRYLQSIGQ